MGVDDLEIVHQRTAMPDEYLMWNVVHASIHVANVDFWLSSFREMSRFIERENIQLRATSMPIIQMYNGVT